MSDELERALSIDRENEEFISFGKAWCTRIRTDRSGLGVGMVEEVTGLPITGGRVTCDYAQYPGGLAGTQLAVSALGSRAPARRHPVYEGHSCTRVMGRNTGCFPLMTSNSASSLRPGPKASGAMAAKDGVPAAR